MIKYLALGDSYTIGEAVRANESFPYLLASKLNTESYLTATPTIIATTGWTTDELINAVAESDILDKKYDIVTLLIGVNDQYRKMSEDNYRIKFEQILNTAIHFANGDKNRVFVLSIPDWGVTPFAEGKGDEISPVIDQFNAINKQITTEAGVSNYIDITDISRLATDEPDLIADDGLHPSGKMYQLWVDKLNPLVLKRLQ